MKGKTKKKDKLVLGVGINDANYATQRSSPDRWCCPYYSRWKGMLQRCYDLKRSHRNSKYSDCSVCEEWLTFSKFKSWMEKQDWEGKHLDKDILNKGNKVYCPEYCVFINPDLNMFTTERDALRGKYPIGCSWHKSSGKYSSYINNPFTGKIEHLGLFNDPLEAHRMWISRKAEFAEEYARNQQDLRISEALRQRYSNRDKYD